MKRLLSLLIALAMLLSFAACTESGEFDQNQLIQETFIDEVSTSPVTSPETLPPTDPPTEACTEDATEPPIDEGGSFYSKDDVSLYLYTFGCLPQNYITKGEARGYGWSGGSVEAYVPGAAIGGDRFYNREGLLPDADGRKYFECDIDTKGRSSRGAKRIVYSNDGLIYYTSDHYSSFELLYGEES